MNTTRHAVSCLRAAGAIAVLLVLTGQLGQVLRAQAFQSEPLVAQRMEVPFVQQVKHGCGSAALAMLMGYWKAQGHPVAEERASAARIHKRVYSPKHKGSTASTIESYLRDSGFRTFAFEGSWSDIKEHVAKGRPLLVALKPASASRQLHYALVVGAGETHILLHDPAHAPNQLLRRDEFERQWRPVHRWMLLALPPA